VAIVTGASRGLGKAIARVLFEEEYIVIACARSFSDSEKKNYLKFHCDITKRDNIRKIVDAVIQKYDRIDVLINNAGLMIYDNFVEMKETDLDEMYSINVKGVMLFSQAVIPIMRKQKEGYIINMSSVRGITGAPNKGAYSATKFAVRGLTETILAENKKYGIKATSICPGLVYTEQTKNPLPKYGLTKKDVLTKKDIANTILYLLNLSPKAHVREIVIGGRLYG
jgi:NADP-dependent 3-hydroxy acid dehydrogenase YdfG